MYTKTKIRWNSPHKTLRSSLLGRHYTSPFSGWHQPWSNSMGARWFTRMYSGPVLQYQPPHTHKGKSQKFENFLFSIFFITICVMGLTFSNAFYFISLSLFKQSQYNKFKEGKHFEASLTVLCWRNLHLFELWSWTFSVKIKIESNKIKSIWERKSHYPRGWHSPKYSHYAQVKSRFWGAFCRDGAA